MRSTAELRVPGGAERGADAEPSARADADAGNDRQDGSRQGAGVLQGPVRRRQRLHVRVRRHVRSGGAASRWSRRTWRRCRRPAARRRGRTTTCVPPTTVVERRVEKGLEPQSHSRIVFTGPVRRTTRSSASSFARLASILQTRLREILREELGGTYSVSASAGYDKMPDARSTASRSTSAAAPIGPTS